MEVDGESGGPLNAQGSLSDLPDSSDPLFALLTGLTCTSHASPAELLQAQTACFAIVALPVGNFGKMDRSPAQPGLEGTQGKPGSQGTQVGVGSERHARTMAASLAAAHGAMPPPSTAPTAATRWVRVRVRCVPALVPLLSRTPPLLKPGAPPGLAPGQGDGGSGAGAGNGGLQGAAEWVPAGPEKAADRRELRALLARCLAPPDSELGPEAAGLVAAGARGDGGLGGSADAQMTEVVEVPLAGPLSDADSDEDKVAQDGDAGAAVSFGRARASPPSALASQLPPTRVPGAGPGAVPPGSLAGLAAFGAYVSLWRCAEAGSRDCRVAHASLRLLAATALAQAAADSAATAQALGSGGGELAAGCSALLRCPWALLPAPHSGTSRTPPGLPDSSGLAGCELGRFACQLLAALLADRRAAVAAADGALWAPGAAQRIRGESGSLAGQSGHIPARSASASLAALHALLGAGDADGPLLGALSAAANALLTPDPALPAREASSVHALADTLLQAAAAVGATQSGALALVGAGLLPTLLRLVGAEHHSPGLSPGLLPPALAGPPGLPGLPGEEAPGLVAGLPPQESVSPGGGSAEVREAPSSPGVREESGVLLMLRVQSGRDGLSGRAVRVLESVLELSAIAQDGHAAHGRARAALLGDLGGAGGAALPTNAVEVAVTLDAASLLVSRAAAEVASCEAIYHQLCDAAESGKPGESGREAAESGSVALPGPLPAEGVRGEVRDEVRDEVLGGQAGGESLSRAPMVPPSKRSLLRGLLRTFALLLHSSGGSRSVRLAAASSEVAAVLAAILARPSYYGAPLFAISASVLCDCLHNDPLVLPRLHAVGVTTTILRVLTNTSGLSESAPGLSESAPGLPAPAGLLDSRTSGLPAPAGLLDFRESGIALLPGSASIAISPAADGSAAGLSARTPAAIVAPELLPAVPDSPGTPVRMLFSGTPDAPGLSVGAPGRLPDSTGSPELQLRAETLARLSRTLAGCPAETVPVSTEAMVAIPSVLAALCLGAEGLAEVSAARPVAAVCGLLCATSHRRATHGAVPALLGAGLDELLRHAPSLRTDGINDLVRHLHGLRHEGARLAAAQAASANPENESVSPEAAMGQESGTGVRESGTGVLAMGADVMVVGLVHGAHSHFNRRVGRVVGLDRTHGSHQHSGNPAAAVAAATAFTAAVAAAAAATASGVAAATPGGTPASAAAAAAAVTARATSDVVAAAAAAAAAALGTPAAAASVTHSVTVAASAAAMAACDTAMAAAAAACNAAPGDAAAAAAVVAAFAATNASGAAHATLTAASEGGAAVQPGTAVAVREPSVRYQVVLRDGGAHAPLLAVRGSNLRLISAGEAARAAVAAERAASAGVLLEKLVHSLSLCEAVVHPQEHAAAFLRVGGATALLALYDCPGLPPGLTLTATAANAPAVGALGSAVRSLAATNSVASFRAVLLALEASLEAIAPLLRAPGDGNSPGAPSPSPGVAGKSPGVANKSPGAGKSPGDGKNPGDGKSPGIGKSPAVPGSPDSGRLQSEGTGVAAASLAWSPAAHAWARGRGRLSELSANEAAQLLRKVFAASSQLSLLCSLLRAVGSSVALQELTTPIIEVEVCPGFHFQDGNKERVCIAPPLLAAPGLSGEKRVGSLLARLGALQWAVLAHLAREKSFAAVTSDRQLAVAQAGKQSLTAPGLPRQPVTAPGLAAGPSGLSVTQWDRRSAPTGQSGRAPPPGAPPVRADGSRPGSLMLQAYRAEAMVEAAAAATLAGASAGAAAAAAAAAGSTGVASVTPAIAAAALFTLSAWAGGFDSGLVCVAADAHLHAGLAALARASGAAASGRRARAPPGGLFPPLSGEAGLPPLAAAHAVARGLAAAFGAQLRHVAEAGAYESGSHEPGGQESGTAPTKSGEAAPGSGTKPEESGAAPKESGGSGSRLYESGSALQKFGGKSEEPGGFWRGARVALGARVIEGWTGLLFDERPTGLSATPPALLAGLPPDLPPGLAGLAAVAAGQSASVGGSNAGAASAVGQFGSSGGAFAASLAQVHAVHVSPAELSAAAPVAAPASRTPFALPDTARTPFAGIFERALAGVHQLTPGPVQQLDAIIAGGIQLLPPQPRQQGGVQPPQAARESGKGLVPFWANSLLLLEVANCGALELALPLLDKLLPQMGHVSLGAPVNPVGPPGSPAGDSNGLGGAEQGADVPATMEVEKDAVPSPSLEGAVRESPVAPGGSPAVASGSQDGPTSAFLRAASCERLHSALSHLLVCAATPAYTLDAPLTATLLAALTAAAHAGLAPGQAPAKVRESPAEVREGPGGDREGPGDADGGFIGRVREFRVSSFPFQQALEAEAAEAAAAFSSPAEVHARAGGKLAFSETALAPLVAGLPPGLPGLPPGLTGLTGLPLGLPLARAFSAHVLVARTHALLLNSPHMRALLHPDSLRAAPAGLAASLLLLLRRLIAGVPAPPDSAVLVAARAVAASALIVTTAGGSDGPGGLAGPSGLPGQGQAIGARRGAGGSGLLGGGIGQVREAAAVAAAAAAVAASTAAAAARTPFLPSDETLEALANMGFSRASATRAARTLRSTNVRVLVEWLLEQPPALDEDQESPAEIPGGAGQSEQARTSPADSGPGLEVPDSSRTPAEGAPAASPGDAGIPATAVADTSAELTAAAAKEAAASAAAAAAAAADAAATAAAADVAAACAVAAPAGSARRLLLQGGVLEALLDRYAAGGPVRTRTLPGFPPGLPPGLPTVLPHTSVASLKSGAAASSQDELSRLQLKLPAGSEPSTLLLSLPANTPLSSLRAPLAKALPHVSAFKTGGRFWLRCAFPAVTLDGNSALSLGELGLAPSATLHVVCSAPVR